MSGEIFERSMMVISPLLHQIRVTYEQFALNRLCIGYIASLQDKRLSIITLASAKSQHISFWFNAYAYDKKGTTIPQGIFSILRAWKT